MKTFRLQRPAGRTLPVVVSVPHAGLAVPTEVEDQVSADERTLRADADLAVDELYEGVVEAGATLLVANVSRFVVDLNRATGDVDALSVPAHPAPLLDARRGVVWRLATSGRPVLARPLSMEELGARLQRYYAPYHDALRRALAEVREAHGFALLLDGHSMPGHARTEAGGLGRKHADIVPGCQGGTSCAPAVVRAACEHFDGRGYTVAVDDPYRGGFITRHYGQPRAGVHALQLEVNRDLYMDPLQLTVKPRALGKLRADLLAFVARLGALPLG